MKIAPLDRPPDATVVVPGSKSLTNRVLLCAALADGSTTIEGALDADDTAAMADCLRAAGVSIDEWTVTGAGGAQLLSGEATLDARKSGTTARFLLPVVAASRGRYILDGDSQLRARPLGPLLEAVVSLGGKVEALREPGHLPLAISGTTIAGGTSSIAGNVTSQFVSALLLAAPGYAEGLALDLHGGLVSAPYVEMTRRVMSDFGVDVRGLSVPPGSTYRSPGRYAIEPDASSASYFLAAAAITGGRVTVEGLGRQSLQGDLRFATDVLSRIGAEVEQTDSATTVIGTGTIRGGEYDLSSMPDMAQTLAAIAVFADAPTTVTGVGFIRGHETDRIKAVVAELRRARIRAHELAGGFVVHPGTPRPARIETYDDHRMAMAFTLVGLKVPGIEIADPDCVAKTFPGFFEALDQLR